MSRISIRGSSSTSVDTLISWANENLDDVILVKSKSGSLEGYGHTRKSFDEIFSKPDEFLVEETHDSTQLNRCCLHDTVILNTCVPDYEKEARKLRYSNIVRDKIYNELLEWALHKLPDKPHRKEVATRLAEITRQHKQLLNISTMSSIVDTCLYDIGEEDFLHLI